MAMAVEGVNADPLTLITKIFEVVAVGVVARRDQTLAFGRVLRLIDQLRLFRRADGNFALASALGPRILEHEATAAIRPLGDDLDRLCPAQTKQGLQTERHVNE